MQYNCFDPNEAIIIDDFKTIIRKLNMIWEISKQNYKPYNIIAYNFLETIKT